MAAEYGPAFDYMVVHEDSQRSWKEITDNNGAIVIAGVNAQYFPDAVARIQALPQANRGPEIAKFYFGQFWVPNFGRLTSQRVASKLLDMAVNNGLQETVILSQRAVNALCAPVGIKVDGEFGAASLAAVNGLPEAQFLGELVSQLKDHYRAVEKTHPEDVKFDAAWMRRAEELPA